MKPTCPTCGQRLPRGNYCLVAHGSGTVSVFKTLPEAVKNWTTSNSLHRWDGNEPVDLLPGEFDHADDLLHGRTAA